MSCAWRILQHRKIFYVADAFEATEKGPPFIDSHLSESRRSKAPYFCYLLALRRSDSTGVAMRMIASKRRSSFGTNCVQCGNELIAPERSEYRDGRQIRHFWHCSKCEWSFEVVAPSDTKSIENIMIRIEDIMRRRDVFRSRLVA